MFNKFFIILLFVLLGTMAVDGTSLQAMYIPDLWEDIWEEDALTEWAEAEQASRLNTLLDADNLVIPDGLIETIIGMDKTYHLMSDEEKRESVHTLRAFLHETAGLRREAAKEILRSLCNKTNSEFKNLSSEEKNTYSIQELQALFEKSVDYKTRMQLIIKQIREIIEKNVSILKQKLLEIHQVIFVNVHALIAAYPQLFATLSSCIGFIEKDRTQEIVIFVLLSYVAYYKY